MLKSIWDDISNYFRTGGMVARLIIINIAVWAGVAVLSMFMNMGSGFSFSPRIVDFLKFFALNSDGKYMALHPWGIFTHMFLHHDLGHLFWNMVSLYIFGDIVQRLLGNSRILPLYIMGGLSGALAFFLACILVPSYGPSFGIGASAAIMAFVTAAGFYAPDLRISLLFFETKLKFVMLAVVFLDLIGASSNAGNTGHFAHLGGALFGWFFIFQLKEKRRDLSVPFNHYWAKFVKVFQPGAREEIRRPRPKVAYRNDERIGQGRRRGAAARPGRQSDYGSVEDQVNAILDKMNRKGKSSLTREEWKFLDEHRDKL